MGNTKYLLFITLFCSSSHHEHTSKYLQSSPYTSIHSARHPKSCSSLRWRLSHVDSNSPCLHRFPCPPNGFGNSVHNLNLSLNLGHCFQSLYCFPYRSKSTTLSASPLTLFMARGRCVTCRCGQKIDRDGPHIAL